MPAGGANPSFTFLLGRTQSRGRAPALGVRAGRAVRPHPVPRAGMAGPAARLGAARLTGAESSGKGRKG
jgi:hypothetical protein